MARTSSSSSSSTSLVYPPVDFDVFSWIFIGDKDLAKNLSLLRQRDIAYVINCTPEVASGGLPHYHLHRSSSSSSSCKSSLSSYPSRKKAPPHRSFVGPSLPPSFSSSLPGLSNGCMQGPQPCLNGSLSGDGGEGENNKKEERTRDPSEEEEKTSIMTTTSPTTSSSSFSDQRPAYLLPGSSSSSSSSFVRPLEYYRLDMVDNSTESLSKHFEPFWSIMERARIRENGSVLVHCHQGVSRSVSMVMSYLIKYFKMSVSEALKLVRVNRPVAKPNEAFMSQLKELHSSLLQDPKTYPPHAIEYSLAYSEKKKKDEEKQKKHYEMLLALRRKKLHAEETAQAMFRAVEKRKRILGPSLPLRQSVDEDKEEKKNEEAVENHEKKRRRGEGEGGDADREGVVMVVVGPQLPDLIRLGKKDRKEQDEEEEGGEQGGEGCGEKGRRRRKEESEGSLEERNRVTVRKDDKKENAKSSSESLVEIREPTASFPLRGEEGARKRNDKEEEDNRVEKGDDVVCIGETIVADEIFSSRDEMKKRVKEDDEGEEQGPRRETGDLPSSSSSRSPDSIKKDADASLFPSAVSHLRAGEKQVLGVSGGEKNKEDIEEEETKKLQGFSPVSVFSPAARKNGVLIEGRTSSLSSLEKKISDNEKKGGIGHAVGEVQTLANEKEERQADVGGMKISLEENRKSMKEESFLLPGLDAADVKGGGRVDSPNGGVVLMMREEEEEDTRDFCVDVTLEEKKNISVPPREEGFLPKEVRMKSAFNETASTLSSSPREKSLSDEEKEEEEREKKRWDSEQRRRKEGEIVGKTGPSLEDDGEESSSCCCSSRLSDAFHSGDGEENKRERTQEEKGQVTRGKEEKQRRRREEDDRRHANRMGHSSSSSNSSSMSIEEKKISSRGDDRADGDMRKTTRCDLKETMTRRLSPGEDAYGGEEKSGRDEKEKEDEEGIRTDRLGSPERGMTVEDKEELKRMSHDDHNNMTTVHFRRSVKRPTFLRSVSSRRSLPPPCSSSSPSSSHIPSPSECSSLQTEEPTVNTTHSEASSGSPLSSLSPEDGIGSSLSVSSSSSCSSISSSLSSLQQQSHSATGLRSNEKDSDEAPVHHENTRGPSLPRSRQACEGGAGDQQACDEATREEKSGKKTLLENGESTSRETPSANDEKEEEDAVILVREVSVSQGSQCGFQLLGKNEEGRGTGKEGERRRRSVSSWRSSRSSSCRRSRSRSTRGEKKPSFSSCVMQSCDSSCQQAKRRRGRSPSYSSSSSLDDLPSQRSRSLRRRRRRGRGFYSVSSSSSTEEEKTKRTSGRRRRSSSVSPSSSSHSNSVERRSRRFSTRRSRPVASKYRRGEEKAGGDRTRRGNRDDLQLCRSSSVSSSSSFLSSRREKNSSKSRGGRRTRRRMSPSFHSMRRDDLHNRSDVSPEIDEELERLSVESLSPRKTIVTSSIERGSRRRRRDREDSPSPFEGERSSYHSNLGEGRRCLMKSPRMSSRGMRERTRGRRSLRSSSVSSSCSSSISPGERRRQPCSSSFVDSRYDGYMRDNSRNRRHSRSPSPSLDSADNDEEGRQRSPPIHRTTSSRSFSRSRGPPRNDYSLPDSSSSSAIHGERKRNRQEVNADIVPAMKKRRRDESSPTLMLPSTPPTATLSSGDEVSSESLVYPAYPSSFSFDVDREQENFSARFKSPITRRVFLAEKPKELYRGRGEESLEKSSFVIRTSV
ncbi:dual specificity catalytic domain-containing protein [Cystoisospora suis]|uniref:Dual specificity catalytic domain-containing protein n=1 Tax=Cystoisospora suis TaxID=483139 RepID=A0A2C6KIL4_9APIC|nr:dual specificity catalytic domain-containing protein [Cystoisospora suis]